MFSVDHPDQAVGAMGRLTFNVLLSFAQFEREVTGERIRDIRRFEEEGDVGPEGPTTSARSCGISARSTFAT